MNPDKKSRAGVILLEILVYTAILAVAGTLIGGIFSNVKRVQNRQIASKEVVQEYSFVVQTIQRYVSSASLIEMATSTQSDTLKLRIASSSKDPTYIGLRNGKIEIKEGSGASTTITGDDVVVDRLYFQKIAKYPGHDAVQIDLVISYDSSNPQLSFSKSLNSIIARVNAATFDDNVLPGTGSTYDLGSASASWRNAYLSDGSAASPTYTFSSDTNVGMFRPGNDILGFTTAGTERMRIDAGGNVGIGTTTPSAKFAFTGDGTGATRTFVIADSANTERVSILNNGNVGIGTATPLTKLEVSGNASTTQLTTTNNTYLATTGGRVGIGTVSPQGYLGITNGTENVFGDTTELMITAPSLNPLNNGKGNLTIQSNDAMAADKGGSIVFGGRVTTGSTNSAHWGGIVGYKENNTSSNYGGYLAFYTRDLSANEGERMRINASGNVGIGTTTPLTQFHVPGKVPTGAAGSVAAGTTPYSVYVQGRYAYVVNAITAGTLKIFDVSNPASPSSVGSVAAGDTPYSVYVQGKYAYVVNYTSNTLQIFDVSNPASPSSVGSVATGASPASVYVQGRYAYVVSRTASKLEIFDVSNPASPSSAGSVTSTSSLCSVYVQERYAYVMGTNANVLQILDASTTSPISVGSVAAGTGNAPCSIYVQGRYAYAVYRDSDLLRIFDVSNPASPSSVGSVATGANPLSVYVQGRYAYVVNTTANTLQIFDVSNPASPSSVGSVAAGTYPASVYVQGRYAYVADATGGTLKIFDVGGAYIQQFEAGGIETGTLQTRSNLTVNNDLDVKGGAVFGKTIQASGITDTKGAYGQAYRTTSYSPAAVNTWYDLDLDAGNNNLVNVSHSTVTTPDRITVTYAGVYKIHYSVQFRNTTSVNNSSVARLRKNDTTEISASWGQVSTTATGEHISRIDRKVIVSLAAADYISLQVGTNNTAVIVDKYDDGNVPDPTTFITAVVIIEKIE